MSAPLQPGMRVADRYDLLAVLGEGGMAVVYEAYDSHIQRRVALKILQKKAPAAMARFEREARAASALHHPAVVKVFGVGSLPTGQPYIALEFIEGETLIEVVERTGPMPPERALALIMPVVGALAEAHAAGIVHRDIKPSNLMMQRAAGQFESLRLLDFGIASMGEHDGERLTRTGEIFGTPEFMSPEQAMGRPAGPTTDIWALGAVLYEVLAGRPPFTGTHAPGILYKVVNEPLPPLDPFIPDELSELVEECLAKDPADRPPDGATLLTRMESLLLPAPRQLVSSRPSASMPIETPEQPTAPPLEAPEQPIAPPAADDQTPRRSRKWVSALIVVLALGLAAIWWAFDGAQSARPPVAQPASVVAPGPASPAEPTDAAVPDAAPSSDAGAPTRIPDAAPGVDASRLDAAPAEDAAPDAAPVGDARPAPLATTGIPAAIRAKVVQTPRDALSWLQSHPKQGTAAERDGLELRARLALRDMGLSAKVLQRMAKAHPEAIDPARPELLSALTTSKFWRSLVPPLAHPALFPRVEAELMGMTRNGKAGRWRALRVIQKAKGDWKQARSHVLIHDLKRAANCGARKKLIVELGRLGQPVALGPIKAQRGAVGFSNLCMGSAIDDALRAIRRAGLKR